MPRRSDISKILIIGSGPRLVLAPVVALILLLIFVPVSRACVRSFMTVQVQPSFKISVTNGATPEPGIKVGVYDEEELNREPDPSRWKPVLDLTTSAEGLAEVTNLPAGTYVVRTTGPGSGSAVSVRVGGESAKVSNQISLEWPFQMMRSEILRTKTLVGNLGSNNPWKPFANLHVELWSRAGGSPLAAQDTDSEGHFHFPELQPGIYILRVRGHQQEVDSSSQVEGEIPVNLSSDSTNSPEALSLYLGMSDCGITYNSCPTPGPMGLPSRRIQIHDPLGAVIGDAKYRVLAPDGREVAGGLSDSSGIVDLSPELKGRVILVVFSPGFTRFELPLDLIPSTDSAEYLSVEMAVQGYGGEKCSAASLVKNATP